MARDDFSAVVKQQLAMRANHRCSNPSCRAQTSGPRLDPASSVNIGVAAHITAAAAGGPRFRAGLRPEQRASAENGIWLCQNCAKLVDNDETRYPEELLLEWKAGSDDEALRRLGKTMGTPQSTPRRDSIDFELRRESNPRFGFSFSHPAYWDRQDPTNGDGNTYRYPRDPRVEVCAWGRYAVMSADLHEWVQQTLEFLSKEPKFTLLSRVPSGRHLVDAIETPSGVVESR